MTAFILPFACSLFFYFFKTPGRIFRQIKERVRNIQLQRSKQLFLTRAASGRQSLQHVREGKIQQQLDHFNRRDVGTFPQVEKNATAPLGFFFISKLAVDVTNGNAKSNAWKQKKPIYEVKSSWKSCRTTLRKWSTFQLLNSTLSLLQRFFVNEAYWRSPDGPVFLFIGGEGPLYEYDVLAGTEFNTHKVNLLSMDLCFSKMTQLQSYFPCFLSFTALLDIYLPDIQKSGASSPYKLFFDTLSSWIRYKCMHVTLPHTEFDLLSPYFARSPCWHGWRTRGSAIGCGAPFLWWQHQPWRPENREPGRPEQPAGVSVVSLCVYVCVCCTSVVINVLFCSPPPTRCICLLVCLLLMSWCSFSLQDTVILSTALHFHSY